MTNQRQLTGLYEAVSQYGKLGSNLARAEEELSCRLSVEGTCIFVAKYIFMSK